jgi:hypothetical protein
LVLPEIGIDSMNEHLAAISRCVSVSSIALLILDGAGWHGSPKPMVPKNIVLMPLPPYAPERNSVENIWDYLRSNYLSHCVWRSYDAIVDACCKAWNALMAHRSKVRAAGITSTEGAALKPGCECSKIIRRANMGDRCAVQFQ